MQKINARSKYLLKNMAIFTLGSMSTKLISFFLVPIYTYVLAAEQYGIIDLLTTICTVLAPIIILNIGESVMRFSLDKGADVNGIISAGLTVFMIAAVAGVLIIPLAETYPVVSEYAVYIYFYTVSLASVQLLLCILRGKEQLIAYSIGNIIQTAAVAGLNIYFLVFLGQGIKGYMKAYIGAALITAVYALWAGSVKSAIKEFHLNPKLMWDMIKYSAVLIPNTFMWWIMNASDRIMVTAMVGAAANGIYAVSYKLPAIVVVFSGIFNQAFGYSAVHENESKDRDEYTNGIFDKFVCAVVMAGVALLFVMKPFLRYYVEDSYYPAWQYTPYLVIGNVFLCIATFLSTPYYVNKDSKGFLYSSTVGAIANVVLNFLLIPDLGVTGAALATCISYICVLLYRVVDTHRYVKIKVIRIKHLLAYAILVLAGAAMFVDGLTGEGLMFAAIVAEILVFRSTWLPVMKKFVGAA